MQQKFIKVEESYRENTACLTSRRIETENIVQILIKNSKVIIVVSIVEKCECKQRNQFKYICTSSKRIYKRLEK